MKMKQHALAAVLAAVTLGLAHGQVATTNRPPLAGTGPARTIQTFMVKLRGGAKYVPGDEKTLARFDMLMITRNWHNAIDGATWKAVQAVNPAIEIYIQVEGPTIWRKTDRDRTDLLKDIARLQDSRGHSMGSIEKDHPDFFLRRADGGRCLAYKSEYDERYLMDFGSPDYQRYWIEAVTTDVVKQPWRGAGLHIDNTGPLCTFQTEVPAKYDTEEKWSAAADSFINAVTKALHTQGQNVWINAGGTASAAGWKVLLALDSLENPPDVVGEEVAFCHRAGKASTTFPSEEKWKRQVDFLSRLKKCRQAYFSHTKLPPDGEGVDNLGRPVTFWQALYYAMGSYLLGKDDRLNNAYFFFCGEAEYGAKDWWFPEYERINLGKAAGPYQVLTLNGANIYWRQFEKGYVYVNPTATDVSRITLPGPHRALSHENITRNPEEISPARELAIRAHHAAVLLRAD